MNDVCVDERVRVTWNITGNMHLIILTFCILKLGLSFGEIHILFTSSGYAYKILDDHGFNSSGLESIVFRIKSCQDAHIGLLETYDVNGSMYEILFGGWTNTKCTIRRVKQGINLVEVNEVVLDCSTYVELWVSWFGGTIEVGRGTGIGCDVFMSWTDPTPRAVTYIGTAMWYRSADWVFGFPHNSTDCPSTSTEYTDTTTVLETTTSETTPLSSETTTLSSETTTLYSETTTLYSITTPDMVTTIADDSTMDGSCQCPCEQVNTFNLTDQELFNKIKQLKLELTIVSKYTNKYKRTLISSPDERASSKVIGWSGILVLVFVFGSLIVLDIQHFGSFLTSKVASHGQSS